MGAVLLYGHLSKEKLDQSFDEIRVVMDRSACAVDVLIKSEGGDAVAAVEFAESVRKLPLTCFVKIYEAVSAAAYIALAISDFREMKKGTKLSLHRGDFIISPTDVDPEGKLYGDTLKAFKSYNTALFEVIERCGLEEFTSKLLATDWMHLSAEECLKRGIVSNLF